MRDNYFFRHVHSLFNFTARGIALLLRVFAALRDQMYNMLHVLSQALRRLTAF